MMNGHGNTGYPREQWCQLYSWVRSTSDTLVRRRLATGSVTVGSVAGCLLRRWLASDVVAAWPFADRTLRPGSTTGTMAGHKFSPSIMCFFEGTKSRVRLVQQQDGSSSQHNPFGLPYFLTHVTKCFMRFVLDLPGQYLPHLEHRHGLAAVATSFDTGGLFPYSPALDRTPHCFVFCCPRQVHSFGESFAYCFGRGTSYPRGYIR